jgi:hypothetical protein
MTTAAMKMLKLMLAAGLAGVVTGCLEQSAGQPGVRFGALLRVQWLGTAQLARDTNAARVCQILALPESAAFREELLGKLARVPYQCWSNGLPKGVPDQAPLIRPLLEDLARQEWYLELQGSTAAPEVVLAVQVTGDRARLWSTNLWQVVHGWKLGVPQPLPNAGGQGWQLKKAAAPNLIQFAQSGSWVLVGLGQEPLKLLPGLVQQVRANGRPVPALQAHWLEVQADLPALRGWLPVLEDFRLPPVHLTVRGLNGHVRTEAKLHYSANLAWKPEPWKLPTNAIRDPIISFTAARGIAPLLAQVKGVTGLGLNPLPDQLCAWAGKDLFAQTYVTFPVPHATNALHQLARTVPGFTQLHPWLKPSQVVYWSNRAELMWQGVPLAVPTLRPLRDSGSDYVLACLFPLSSPTNAPPPAQLYAQLQGRQNLAYYDWEYTQERLRHMRPLYQILDIAHRRQFIPTNAPSQVWIRAIAPYLGNTITELTVTGPKELTLTRKSELGLTGFELYTLTRWLESPGFPKRFELPPPAPDPRAGPPPGLTNPGPRRTR